MGARTEVIMRKDRAQCAITETGFRLTINKFRLTIEQGISPPALDRRLSTAPWMVFGSNLSPFFPRLRVPQFSADRQLIIAVTARVILHGPFFEYPMSLRHDNLIAAD